MKPIAHGMDSAGGHGLQRGVGRAGGGKTDWNDRSRAMAPVQQRNLRLRRQGATTPSSTGEEMETYRPFTVSMGQALWVIMLVAGPPLIVISVVGLAISMIQAATSIDEQSVSFAPKLLAFILFLTLYGATAGDLLIHYTRDLLMHIPADIR
jgi:flagellar biosynthetic protein FliQ